MPKTSTNSSASRPETDRFSATRWSLVAGLDQGELERQRCLAELCQNYFFPVYAHVRASGEDKAKAYELTQSFLSEVLSGLDDSAPDGRFRTFLLEQLNEYLAHPTNISTIALTVDLPSRPEVEQRYSKGRHLGNQGNDAFNANYATEVLNHSLKRLESEAADNDRLQMFQRLVRYLVREPTDEEYRGLSEALNLSKLSLVVALKRLRARFNELVNRELSDTVGNPADLEQERNVLFDVLRAQAKS